MIKLNEKGHNVRDKENMWLISKFLNFLFQSKSLSCLFFNLLSLRDERETR
jgi:hypothetical protein